MCERYWQWGNVRLWLRGRTRCERGEPQAWLVFSKALGWDPEALPLGRDVRGRPRFAGPLSVWDIGWSHSGDYLLLALGYRGCLGVDLERERFRPHLLDLAQRFSIRTKRRYWVHWMSQHGRRCSSACGVPKPF